MKIYVISLPGSDRRFSIAKQFEEHDVTFEFFDAVDGRRETISQYDSARRVKMKAHGMTPGENGCFASHRKLWEKCIELKEPIVILEDDVNLTDFFWSELSNIESLVLQFDYIRLGRGTPKKMFGMPWWILRENICGCGVNLVKYMRGPSCTHAYIISPDASSRLLTHSVRWWWPVDDYMDYDFIHGVDNVGVEPPLVLQTDIPSVIGYADRKKGKRSVLARIRKEIYRFIYGLRSLIYNARFAVTQTLKKRGLNELRL